MSATCIQLVPSNWLWTGFINHKRREHVQWRNFMKEGFIKEENTFNEEISLPRRRPSLLDQFHEIIGLLQIERNFHGLVDPLFVTSWQKWNRYKLHCGIELVPWHKEWPDGGIWLVPWHKERFILTSPRPNGTGLVQPTWNRFESRVFIENWKWVSKGCGSYLIHPGKPLAFPPLLPIG